MQACCIRVTAGRGVAQPGSVLAWGARGRVFESLRPDQINKPFFMSGFFYFGAGTLPCRSHFVAT